MNTWYLTPVCLSLLLMSCALQRDYTGAARQTAELLELEHRVFSLVNEYRRSLNLPPLRSNGVIAEFARRHSVDMARRRVPFSHKGYYSRVYEISRRLEGVSAGENVARIQGMTDPAQAALVGWLKSDGHRKVMEGNFALAGVGAAVDAMGNYYFTHMFWR